MMIINVRFFLMSYLSFCSFLSIITKTVDAQCLNCGPNEILNSCPKYGTSDSDCDAVFGGFKKYCPPQPVDYQCTPRCDCKEGFVRDADKNCILAENCCTGQNEEMTCCPAKCDDTCLGPAFPGCTLVPCFKKGCRCKSDFVRHENACIQRKDCPRTVELARILKPLESVGCKNKPVKNLPKPGARANICLAKNVQGNNGTRIGKLKRPGKLLKPGELPPPPKLSDPGNCSLPFTKSIQLPRLAELNPLPTLSNPGNSSPPPNVLRPENSLSPLKLLTPENSPPAANSPPLKPPTPSNSPLPEKKPLQPLKQTAQGNSPPTNINPPKSCPN
ncbi:uncharacterized protein LOC143910936 [Arctopsyche grandis]|uniref:uncharacterized protein LOC143910936 n=1 Tax=Arctopsyche grandis TaxID=121162 RepID=UPI00406D67C8